MKALLVVIDLFSFSIWGPLYTLQQAIMRILRLLGL